MSRKYVIAGIIVWAMLIVGCAVKAKQKEAEEMEMRVVNISIEMEERQYLALKRRAARLNKDVGAWSVDDEIQMTAEAAIAIQADNEIEREKAALRRSQIGDDFITDDTPIRVVAAQKEETRTLSEDPEGEPAAGADGFITEPENNGEIVAITPKERDLFLRCIQAEAGNQPADGRQAAAEVILNRVADARFPNTITDVIMQSGQFGVVSNGSIETAVPDGTTVKAVEAALEGSTALDDDYVFFNNQPIGRDTIKIGDHYFGR